MRKVYDKDKKIKSGKVHFIIFQTMKKPMTLSFHRSVLLIVGVSFVISLFILSFFLYNISSQNDVLKKQLFVANKTAEQEKNNKEQLIEENMGLKSEIKVKTEQISTSVEELNCLQDIIEQVINKAGIEDDIIKEEGKIVVSPSRASSFRDDKDNNNSEKTDDLLKNGESVDVEDENVIEISQETKEILELKQKFSSRVSLLQCQLGKIQDELREKEEYKKDVPIITPTIGRFTSAYGPRWGGFHRGIDLANKTGTQIWSAADGVVIEVRKNHYSYGNYITIQHKYGFKTRYAHLSKISVKKWQQVGQGDIIGLMGNTGVSYGSHLHYEIHYYGKLINPKLIKRYVKNY